MFYSRKIKTFSLVAVVISVGFADLAILANNQQQGGISLVINEVMASNSSIIQDPQGQYEDWIEIYNAGSTAVNVGGMCLTDDMALPIKWQFPATNIPAYGYLLIWADGDTADSGLHTSFKLSADGEEICLFNTNGSSLIDSITFNEQTPDISYGRYPDGSNSLQFMISPTPKSRNNSGFIDIVAEPEFSHKRGFYDAPFSVTITTETQGAAIYYTLDGSEPYMAGDQVPSGRLYTGPIPISTTTCLRAIAFKADWKTSTIITHTYLFLDDVIIRSQASVIAAGYPASWRGDYVISSSVPKSFRYNPDYEMDPEVYNDPDYAGSMKEALLSIPTLSIVTDKEYLFSPSVGIYMNPESEGGELEWERPTSAELFSPDGSKEFQVNCGLRIQGGHSRKPYKCPKHSFSLRFRYIYGPTCLDYPLFDDWPVDSFDTLHIRGFFNNAWTHWAPDQRERAQYIHDQWARDSLTEMGHKDALQGFYVHLYLNGIYWGLYNLHERPDADHYAAYNDCDAEEIDAINGDPTYVISDPLNTGSVSDGTIDAWLELKNIVATRNWGQICQLIDMDNFIDWTIFNYFSSNTDLKRGTNWRAAGGGPSRKPWRFYSWDSEHILENVDTVSVGEADPTELLEYLVDINEFHMRFVDRLHKHLFNGGALTTERNIQRWTKWADEIDLAVIAESARWGDYRRDVHSYSSRPYYLYTKNEFWIPEKNRLLNDYFPRRTNIVLNYFKNQGMYPNVDAPSFNINGIYQHGGHVLSSARLTLTAPAGTIYYTLDGSDPRLPGTSNNATGGVSSAAVRYTGYITLTKSAHVKSRALNGSTWSALNEATFAVDPVAESLRITEIMYNPSNEPNEEYIEMKNIGTETINLNLVRFTNGISYTFPNTNLTPGAYIVVVKEGNTFTAKYGAAVNITGQYSGSLSDGGERIKLEDAIGQTILDFEYKDGWFNATDGGGSSLTIIDAANPDLSSWSAKDSWRASLPSPGR